MPLYYDYLIPFLSGSHLTNPSHQSPHSIFSAWAGLARNQIQGNPDLVVGKQANGKIKVNSGNEFIGGIHP
jgi:hypothetical protein